MTARANVLGGVAAFSWADRSRSLTELIFDGVTAALADAGVSIRDVDSVVLGAHDLIDGRSLSSMVTAPAAGATFRDEIRLSEDGLAALSLAAARVEAGESQLSVVAAWGRASEGGFLPMSRAAMDPFTEQPFGLTDLDLSAFRLSRWLAANPGREPERLAAAATRTGRRGAAAPEQDDCPHRSPLLPEELPRWADVVAAVIVGREPGRARIAGVGHGTDEGQIGARDWLGMPAVQEAVSGALAAAGGVALDAVGAVEVDGLTLADEALALEAMGFCNAGNGFAALARGDRANRSGGGARGWCYPAMGLVRFVEAFDHVRSGAVRRALATGMGCNGGQTCTAAVLEAP